MTEIGSYLEERNPAAAARTVQGIFDKAAMLSRFPRLGPALPPYTDDRLRALLYGNYRIIYQLDKGSVTILGVFHHARDLDALLEDEGLT